MSRLQDLLNLNAKTVAEIKARRQAEAEAKAAKETAELLATNEKLRALALEHLGDLARELMPLNAEPRPDVPLILGPGPDHFLTVRLHWNTGREQPTLVVDPGPHSSNHYLTLPAEETEVAEYVAWAMRARREARDEAWEELTTHPRYTYDGGGESDEDLFSRVVAFRGTWPELDHLAHMWLSAELLRRQQARAKSESNQATAEKRKTDEAEAILEALRGDAVALALARLFTCIQRDREQWEGRIENASAAADTAWARADHHARAKEQAERAAADAQREKDDAEYRAVEAERKAKDAARRAERGY